MAATTRRVAGTLTAGCCAVFELLPDRSALLRRAASNYPLDSLPRPVIGAGAQRIAGLGVRAGVLFTTGYADGTIFQRAVLDPRVRVLAKPFRQRELRAAIQQALGRSGG